MVLEIHVYSRNVVLRLDAIVHAILLIGFHLACWLRASGLELTGSSMHERV